MNQNEGIDKLRAAVKDMGEVVRQDPNRIPTPFDAAGIAAFAMREADRKGDGVYSIDDALEAAKGFRSSMSVEERNMVRAEIIRRRKLTSGH